MNKKAAKKLFLKKAAKKLFLIELGTYDQGDSINGSASKFETSGSLKLPPGKKTTNDYIEWLNMAAAIAALHDSLSGGYVNMAVVWKSKKKMKKKGGHFTRRDHVLEILARDFDKLERYMEKVFMVVTYGMRYNLFNESQFKKSILDINMEGVETAHLLAVGECSAENPDTIITRVIVFDSADARSSSEFQPGDGVLVFSDDNYDCEFFMPTSDGIAKLCEFLPSVEEF